jgi:hypothetical protein
MLEPTVRTRRPFTSLQKDVSSPCGTVITSVDGRWLKAAFVRQVSLTIRGQPARRSSNLLTAVNDLFPKRAHKAMADGTFENWDRLERIRSLSAQIRSPSAQIRSTAAQIHGQTVRIRSRLQVGSAVRTVAGTNGAHASFGHRFGILSRSGPALL